MLIKDSETIDSVMEQRSAIMKLACDYFSEIEYLKKNGTHEELLKFHEKIYTQQLPKKNTSADQLKYSGLVKICLFYLFSDVRHCRLMLKD